MGPARHGRRLGRRRRRRLGAFSLIVAALVVGTVLAARPGRGPSTPPTTSSTTSTAPVATTTAPAATGPVAVGAVTFTVTEPATASSGARSFPVTVRYPALGTPGEARSGLPPRPGPYPLVIFSQGFDISPEAYAGLLDAWSAAGYVVADPAYPHTSPGAAGGVLRSDIVHHPADLSFLVTTLLADDHATGPLAGMIAPAPVGVIGQSDGGDVSLAVAANTCCRDRRIGAAILLSGAELSWFPGSYFTGGSAPLLVVQGTADHVMNPVTCSVTLYDAAPRPRYYLSMLGQDHLSAYVPPGPARATVAAVTTDFLNAYLKHIPGALAAMRAAGDVVGRAHLTSQSALPPVAGTCPDAPAN
ncbi:MAG: alpha/beta hydrolase family protein [Acidimicrobiales bacterium]